jgi:hypothetical protein
MVRMKSFICDKLGGMEKPLRSHKAEFRKMATYRISSLCPLANQKIANTDYHRRGLLLFALCGHEPHSGPLLRKSFRHQRHHPDFSPIEMEFSKLKALLRAAAARTVPDLWQAIADAIKQVKPDECRTYFKAAGYDAYQQLMALQAGSVAQSF